MENRDNLLEKFNTAQTQVASLLEEIMNEKSEIKTQRDKLDLRLKESRVTIRVLRRQIELYKVSHSKLKNIFLSGLEVFKKVDFRSNASIEMNKFSLEILQKHFVEHADELDALFEIPTERQLERYFSQKNTELLEDSNTRRIIVSSSDSEDVGPDDTYIEFGTAWNPDKSGGDEELLRDSGLESVKEEIGANEVDLSDIQFGEDFSGSAEFAAGERNSGRSEVVKCGNMTTGTQNIAVPNTGGTSNESIVRVNTPESLHKINSQRNEPARGIYKMLNETQRQPTPVPAVFNHSTKLHDSSALEKGLVNSSQCRDGMTRQEAYTSETRFCKTPVTAPADDTASTMVIPRSRSPVFFRGCNFRRHSERYVEDFSRNCSTPFRQLQFRTLSDPQEYSRTPAKKKLFGRRSTYTKPRQEEDGPSGATRLRLPVLDADRFEGNNQEQGVKSENRENESLEREQLSDCSVYDNTTEEDDDDDIIYESPGKDNQLYLNSRRQEVRRENAEEPSCRPIPQKSDTPDLDETFISPSAVKKYQMSRAMGPPMNLPPGHHTHEVSPEYDSVPFAYQRGPVRKRAERMKLPGQACAECDKYYNNVYGDASTSDYNRMLNKCSRHRNAGGQDDTPPGYWTPFLTGNEEA